MTFIRTVMKGRDIGFIVLGFLVLFILVAGGLYLYHSSRYNEYPVSEGARKVRVTNVTSSPYVVIHTKSRRPVTFGPRESKDVIIDMHEDVSASTIHPDGSNVEHIHRLANEKVNHLYITHDGFRTNLSSSLRVNFVNESDHPVVFIQKSLKGKQRWVSDIVPAKTVSEGHFVGERSMWEVVYPNAEDVPVAEIRVGGKMVSSIIFDGLRLRAI